MKFNLKNRPVKSTPQAYEQWIKGFEKELRKAYKRWSKGADLTALQDAFNAGVCQEIKEILGE